MIKPLVVLFNFLSFIIITALLPADIKVHTKLPDGAQFARGETYTIEVTIEKGAVFGFSKFQVNLPEGYTAEPIETANASFTFADNKIKFIWMAIPETDVVKLSYKLTAGPDAPAQGTLEGTFSYIEDNERKKYDMPAIPISVTEGQTDAVLAAQKEAAEARATRQVLALGDGGYEVRIAIDKKGVEGFAKIEEMLPDGAEASVVAGNKAVFSQVDDRAKFVWMAIPADGQLTVSYKVTGAGITGTALDAMEGNFSFLDQNETKTVAITGSGSVDIPIASDNETSVTPESVEPAPPVSNTAQAETVKNEVAVTNAPVTAQEPTEELIAAVEHPVKPTPTPATKAPIEKAPAPKPAPKAEKSKTAQKTPSVPEPENGVVYRVQVVAAHKVVSEKYIREHFKFNETVSMENHEGWVKYTTGGFDAYKAARDRREEIRGGGHNFPGPFVTAYNSGQRITVQEALMITNQKWYK